MKNAVKTIKTLEIIWPGWTPPELLCKALDRLEEDLVPYWEPYWDGDEEKIGIRFASEEGVIDALPGSVITVENGYAIEAHKSRDDMRSLTTNINEKKRAVAYIYDSGDLEDLKALSETGRRIELKEGRVRVGFCDVPVDVTNSFVVEEPGKEGLTWFHKDSNENTTVEDIARHYEAKLV
jgi:hypothetical protein